MFKWLKEKATQAAANQCKFNIRLNTKTLVSIANRATANINSSGGKTNDNDIRNVVRAQEDLLKDILLGYSNGLSLESIKKEVVDPILLEIEVSDGAIMAVDHVLKSAAETIEATF
jgi:hypothetical protein